MLSTNEKEINQNKEENANLDTLIRLVEERGFEVEKNKDSGAGLIDLVCKVNVHPSLPAINC
jgi:hypothetical protein